MSTDGTRRYVRGKRLWPAVCDSEVTRDGELDACNKPAVAVRYDAEGVWPVCVYHCRVGHMVPLQELLMTAGDQ